MVKTLQRKFLFASMLAVTILLVTLVGAINISYCYSVYSRERNMLEMLCETDGQPEGPGRFRDPNREDAGSMDTGINSEAGLENGQIRDHSGRTDTEQADQAGGLMNGSGRNGFLKHGMSMDEALSIRFFAVWFEENGQAVLTDTSRIYAVSGEEAEEMAQVIVSSGKNTGVYQGFRYLIEEKDCTLSIEAEPVTAAKILVAMDISSDRRDMLRILAISVLIAALCWAAMLLPVNALSRRAIAPTAMSIERQKEFVTNAGHELKTPLAIIQANTDALLFQVLQQFNDPRLHRNQLLGISFLKESDTLIPQGLAFRLSQKRREISTKEFIRLKFVGADAFDAGLIHLLLGNRQCFGRLYATLDISVLRVEDHAVHIKNDCLYCLLSQS